MDEKEFLKKSIEADAKLYGPAPSGGGVKAKLSGISNRIFGIIKLILGICLLAFVYSATLAFLGEFNTVEKSLQNAFWAGVISFTIMYLFVYEAGIVYKKGQRILELIFKFFAPLVKVAPYLLPIYTILIFTIYLLLTLFVKSDALLPNSLFLLGFSLCLHLIFSAKSMRSRQGDFLKSNYIFGFSFIYIVNLLLLCFFLNVIFEKFSFVNFCNNSYQAGAGIFKAIFKQLFL